MVEILLLAREAKRKRRARRRGDASRGSGSPTRGAAAPRRRRPCRDEQAEQSLRPISNWMMLLAVGAVALLAVANLVAAMHCGNRPGRFGLHRC
jgi:hypothetical protein